MFCINQFFNTFHESPATSVILISVFRLVPFTTIAFVQSQISYLIPLAFSFFLFLVLSTVHLLFLFYLIPFRLFYYVSFLLAIVCINWTTTISFTYSPQLNWHNAIQWKRENLKAKVIFSSFEKKTTHFAQISGETTIFLKYKSF